MKTGNNQYIEQLCAAIESLSAGRPTTNDLRNTVPEASNPLKILHDKLTILSQQMEDCNNFVSDLMTWNLNVAPPKNNTLVSPFKQLHSDLRHILWQTQQIASGNYNHKVSFMGDFSTELNNLTYELKEKRKIQEELKELNETKDRLLTILAHDLRNPFCSIIGLTDLMIDQYDKLSAEELKKLIVDLNQTSKDTYGFLENLLTWSRAQSGQIEIMKVPLNLRNLVEEIIKPLFVNANLKNIDIYLDIDAYDEIFADKISVEQIISNLVSNAIKFTPNGGTITIWGEQKIRTTEITVTDNGVGMKPEIQDNIFNSNKSISTFGTNNEKGTGIGLLICKEFAEGNGGKIYVESEYGKGSSFKVIFPNAASQICTS